MNLIQTENLQKSYTDQKLLKKVDFLLNEGDKVGVIGINGAGKSTFLKILAGIEKADGGTLFIHPQCSIRYLPQTPVFEHSCTVLEYVLKKAYRKKDEVKEYEAKSILTKLKITDFDQDVTILSGGQKKRVALACALIAPCSCLILDEPTNHLDYEMVEWLEKRLIKSHQSIIMITHDRYFLERICNRIVEIDQGFSACYDANYSKYLQEKEIRLATLAANERKRQTLLRKELAWIQRGALARSTKSKERIARFEKLQAQEGIKVKEKLKLDSISSRLGNKTIEARHLYKSYGDKLLLDDFSYALKRYERLGIVGENGSGKSTLLNLFAKLAEVDQGEIEIGETVKIEYFRQELQNMDESLRVIDYIRQIGEVIETTQGEVRAADLLEQFLFTKDQQWQPINRLSGGEKRRLYLCSILMSRPNILLLDEPTNDLDIETITILEEFLESFKGAVIAVSHDRYFLDKIADTLLIFKGNGKIVNWLHSYSEYLSESSQEKEVKEKKVSISKPLQSKISYLEKKELESLDDKLSEAEMKVKELEEKLNQVMDFEEIRKIGKELDEERNRLEEITERWLYLSELAEK